MITRPEALKDVKVGGVDYAAGFILPVMELTDELVALERAELVRLHSPYDEPECSGDDDTVRIVYTGREIEKITEAGLFYRMVPSAVTRRHAKLLQRMDFPSTELSFCDVSGLYVGANCTVMNFDTDIAPHLPSSPRVLIMRDEGAGDIIMSTATVRALRKRLPAANITYATRPVYFELLNGVISIDSVISVHDVDLSRRSRWDLVINWCRALEYYGVERNRGPRVESFAKHIGLSLHDRRIELHISGPAYKRAFDLLEPHIDGRALVAYVVQAAAWNRTYPPERLHEIADIFESELPDAKLVLIDRQTEAGEILGERQNIVNLCGQTRSFAEAAAVVALSAMVITPDTGLAHAAGALHKNTLVLCSSIPPEMRFADYRNFRWINPAGRVDCCPCWDWQQRWTAQELRAKPRKGQYRSCMQDKSSHCLGAIPVSEIVERTKDMLGGCVE